MLTVAMMGAILAVDGASAQPTGASGCAGSATVTTVESAAESRFVSNVNALRATRSLGALGSSASLSHSASQWSQTMVSQSSLRHDPGLLSKLMSAVSGFTTGGENVGRSGITGWCTSLELTVAVNNAVDRLHREFLASPTHYRNMVGPYNQVGVGVEIVSGKLWVTLRFAQASLPAATAEATGRYIDALYLQFLGRRATSADISYWARDVQSGNRAGVTRALAVSDEWAGVRINALYSTILDRSADHAGRQYWRAKVAAGTRLEDVAAGFYASREYFIRQGGSNQAFVTGLYRDILGRSPDPGLHFWVALLNTGRANRHGVASGLYASTESRRDRVTDLYGAVLNRRPDGGGLAYWSTSLLTLGDIALASHLASSSEYYQRATR